MSFEEYDRAIRNAEMEFKRMRTLADNLVAEFKKVVSQFVSEWATQIIKRAIEGKPTITKSLGKEKLGQLKTQYNEILKSYPQKVDQMLNKDAIWTHRRDLRDDQATDFFVAESLYGDTTSAIEGALRELIGEVGTLLVEYGFEELNRSSEWERKSGQTVRYRIGIPNDETFQDLSIRYRQIIEKYVEAAQTLVKAKIAKEKAEAKELWDQI